MEGYYKCKQVVGKGTIDELCRQLDKEEIKPELINALLKSVIVQRHDDFHGFVDALIKY